MSGRCETGNHAPEVVRDDKRLNDRHGLDRYYIFDRVHLSSKQLPEEIHNIYILDSSW
jgi:hypothetical protein